MPAKCSTQLMLLDLLSKNIWRDTKSSWVCCFLHYLFTSHLGPSIFLGNFPALSQPMFLYMMMMMILVVVVVVIVVVMDA